MVKTMFKLYNPNPEGIKTGDCVVRAISKALGLSWDEAFALVSAKAYSMGDMPSSNAIWGAVLKDHGFVRYPINAKCPACYTFNDFASENPVGTYVLGTGTHVATVIDGDIYDAWNSQNENPQFVWVKKG